MNTRAAGLAAAAVLTVGVIASALAGAPAGATTTIGPTTFSPSAAAFDAATGQLLVAVTTTLDIFDVTGATETLASSVALSGVGGGVCVDAATATAYVAVDHSTTRGSIAVIDLATATLVETLSLSEPARAVAVGDGHIYATAWVHPATDGELVTIPTAACRGTTTTGCAVASTITVGRSAGSIALSATAVYVANRTSTSIDVITPSGSANMTSLSVAAPGHIAFDAANDVILASNDSGLVSISAASGAEISSLPTAVAYGFSLAVDPTTGAVVVDIGSGQVEVASVSASGTLTGGRQFAAGETPNGIAIDDADHTTYIASNTTSESFVMSLTMTTDTPTSVPPAAPTGVSARRVGTTVAVKWSAATDGGSPITHYSVFATANHRALTCRTTGARTCTVRVTTITPWPTFPTVSFTVTAANLVGTGPASTASQPISLTGPGTPPTLPTAPTAVAAVAGNASATLSWNAPTTNGSSITSYTATSSPAGETCTTSTTSCTLTGLTNGTTYTFTVTATNGVGTGPASSPSNTVTPGGAPGAPTNVAAAAGSGSATISWTAPTTNGSSITSYTVTSSPGGETCTTSTNSCTVTGLTSGTYYTFTVLATNGVGTGPASSPSNAVTPGGAPPAIAMSERPPGPPTLTGVTPSGSGGWGADTISLTWKAPKTTGGSPITDYNVYRTGWFDAAIGPKARTYTLGGLPGGTRINVMIAAVNAMGVGGGAVDDVLVPPTVPSHPLRVVAEPGTHAATVSWTRPASDGGSPITGYVVTSFPGGKACTTSTTSCTITGLNNGTTYTFTIAAFNAVGTSATSAPDVTGVVPAPPPPPPPPPTRWHLAARLTHATLLAAQRLLARHSFAWVVRELGVRPSLLAAAL